MGRIETEDRLRQLPPVGRIKLDVPEAGLEGTQNSIVEGLPLGEKPDAKRRIDIVEALRGATP